MVRVWAARRCACVFFAFYCAKDAFVGPYYVFAVPSAGWLFCSLWREVNGCGWCRSGDAAASEE